MKMNYHVKIRLALDAEKEVRRDSYLGHYSAEGSAILIAALNELVAEFERSLELE